jgi:hypothetical protein
MRRAAAGKLWFNWPLAAGLTVNFAAVALGVWALLALGGPRPR